ncbi:MAG: ribonuclease HI family protein [Actinomycetota bacterium]
MLRTSEAPSYRLRCDGAARGNPGPAGIGVVLEDLSGEVVDELARGIGWATNNVAEYRALIAGLELAQARGVDKLVILMDSRLLVEQMRGAFRVKSPGLKPLHARARELAASFRQISFEAVARGANRAADRLANQGIDGDNPLAEAPGADDAQRLF